MKNKKKSRSASSLLLACCTWLLLLSGSLQAQTLTITGNVIDELGDPVIGANVIVQGTGTGTITDIDGNFTLSPVPNNATVEVSFIGYLTQTVQVKGSAPLKITLKEDSQALDEVVVVGYGVQRKSDLTGSVASVNAETLESRPQANLIQSLQGAVPGLNISVTGSNAEGSSTTTRIRGNNSITADNKPLIILDGIPFDGPWSEINPNDVESIEILKDASSAAIYGARGSNGVILITSKRGKKDKLTVSYDTYVTIDQVINLPRLMNGEEFYKYKVEALKEVNTYTPTPENPEPWLNDLTPTEVASHNAGLSTDWFDLATQTGVKQQHNLSFRGGANKTNYFISLNYTDVKGTAVGNEFKRFNVRFNLDQEFTDWLKFSTTTQLGRYDRSGSNAEFWRAVKQVPLGQAYNEDGSIRLSATEDSSSAFCINPLEALNYLTKDIRAKVITNNVLEVKVPFIKGLSYKLNTGYTYQNSSYKRYRGLDTYDGASANGILNTDDWHSEEWIIENILTYQREFGKHRIFFTGLYSAQSKEYEQNTMEGKNFPNDVMYYYQISKAATVSGSSSYYKQNHISQMGRLNYTYDDRYLLTLTARRDGYSAFGENSKFGVFPSAAIGWNISNESFFKEKPISEIITNLKYRLSWGKNGNEAISAYSTLPNLSTYNYLNDDHTAQYGFYPSKLASPNLGWETTTSVNTGFDISLWNGRIQSSFDIYWSNTKDLLLARSIPTINGTGSITENRGQTKNRGLEFQITSNNIHTKNFNWSTTFNLSHYRTEIVDVGLYDENGNPMDDVASKWFIGEPITVNYDYNIIGIWQIADASNPTGQQDPNYRNSYPGWIKYQDVDGKDDITSADKTIIGSAIPKVNMSLMNSFEYKNFTLSVFLTAQLGQTWMNAMYDTGHNSYRQNRFLVNFWTPDNPTNDYPKNSLSGDVNPQSASFYEKTDFLRVSDITLGYNFPQNWLKHTFIKKLNLYMNIKNLATLTGWTGMDPEFLDNQYAAPPVRSFTFGLKLDI
ncbi:MAG: TonB-dependent receptor [Bacteroides sp.]|nr:TonB-dependent receptor [Bacteroides sp.]